MRWRIILELEGADGRRWVHEIGAGERSPAGQDVAPLGLQLEESKATLATLQRHLVAPQVEEHYRSRRRCDRCGAQRPIKDVRLWRLASLFGARLADAIEHIRWRLWHARCNAPSISSGRR